MNTLLIPLLSVAAAQADVTVLVSSFEAADLPVSALALRLPALVAQEIEEDDLFHVVTLEDALPVGEVNAASYMESCPRGDVAGCSLVVAEANDAEFAITGVVRLVETASKAGASAPDVPGEGTGNQADPQAERPPPPVMGQPGAAADEPGERREEKAAWVARITVSILDVAAFDEALTTEIRLTPADEATFAQSLPSLLLDVVEGRVGLRDIRMRGEAPPPPEEEIGEDEEDARRELEELRSEEGVERLERSRTGLSDTPRREERSQKSMLQLKTAQELRGEAPWEEMGLTSRQYLAWWNSGWEFDHWSSRLTGREGEIVARLELGGGISPTHQYYFGQAAYYSSTEVDGYSAFQEVLTGPGSHVGLSVGYGLAPSWEVELGLARQSGTYEALIRHQDHQGAVSPRLRDSWSQGVLHMWTGARWHPMPYANIRPFAGAGLAFWRGQSLGDHTSSPLTALPPLKPPTVWGLRVLGGGEIAITDSLDIFAQVPLSLALLGTAERSIGKNKKVLLKAEEPMLRAWGGIGVQAGVQYHR